jgi:hypothetical protein
VNADFYIEKGKTHDICEDYAVAGQLGDTALAIVSDGCSSSSDVDFGARILAYAARDTLVPVLVDGRALNVEWLSREIQRKAGAVLGCFDLLASNALDATLLTGTVRPAGDAFLTTVCVWGDGLVLFRIGNTIEAFMVHYGKNAPHYLIYAMRPERNSAYLQAQTTGRWVTRVVFDLDGTELSRSIMNTPVGDPASPLVYEKTLRTNDALVLVTDGVTQFFEGDNTQIPWERLVPEFVNYKQQTGVFLKRRMNFFQRKNKNSGVTHLDDVGSAAIIV